MTSPHYINEDRSDNASTRIHISGEEPVLVKRRALSHETN